MTIRSLKILATSSWVIFSVCAAVVFYLAAAAPNVISSTMINDRDKEVQKIQASTDLREVQQIATMRTQSEAYVMDSARILLIISAATMALCMICSSVSLFQIRRMRRQLYDKSQT
jgi:hypothetical protein